MRSYSFCALFALLSLTALQDLAHADAFKVREGKVEFTAKSNAGFSVQGSADLQSGHLKAVQTENALEIEELAITLPPKQFKTGMDLRDEHLYDRVFKDASGGMKDIQVSASKLACKGKAPVWECEAQLNTEMRGVSQQLPYKLQIKALDQGYEINGQTDVATPAYGVEKIAYMMVELDPAVAVAIKNVKVEKDRAP